jgi:redox-sensing transcriptional repressor
MEQHMPQKVTSLPTIRRLPLYLHLLKELLNEGASVVSGTLLAEKMHCEPIQVRKDLSLTGVEGRPRIGFVIVDTIQAIEDYLGWNNPRDAFLIGVGSLGSALLGYKAFEQNHLRIVAAFDNDKKKCGKTIHGKEVLHISKLEDLSQRMHVHIAILTVPQPVAQEMATYLVRCNIDGIWNFTPGKLVVPSNVIVQNEDLSSGLAVLCKRLQDRSNA